MAVYMLQFDTPLGNPNKKQASASFYLGWCEDRRLGKRLREHFAGRGASITRAAVERGIDLKVVMVIEKATPELERRLKNQKNHERILKRWASGSLIVHPHELGEYPLL